jgi:hypothetical protein
MWFIWPSLAFFVVAPGLAGLVIARWWWLFVWPVVSIGLMVPLVYAVEALFDPGAESSDPGQWAVILSMFYLVAGGVGIVAAAAGVAFRKAWNRHHG